MAVSSFTSLNRDNLFKLVTRADFFTRNPALQEYESQVADCKTAYLQSKKNSSCSCGGNTKLLTPCLEAILTALNDLKETKPEAVDTFVQYVTGHQGGEKKIHVSIYYTKNNGTAAQRYEYVA